MTRGFRPDIQGLRAIAVLAVLLAHASVPVVAGGYVGVDVFFVISGFLITSHLVERLRSTGRIGFADFYARRARRILPAALVVIVLSMVGAAIWMPPVQLPGAFRDAIAAALYVPNYAQAAQGTNYLTVVTPSLFQHYWSLGVEEQFYLVWPALLGGLWALASTRFVRRRFPVARGLLVPIALAAVVLVSLVLCIVMTRVDQPWAFFPLWTRAWELGAGGLAAVVLVRLTRVRQNPVPAVAGAIASWLGLAAIVVAAVGYGDATKFPGIAAALPVAGAVLIVIGGSSGARFGAGLLLDRRPFQFVGRISYSLYLVHWPVLILGAAAAGSSVDLTVGELLLLAAVSLPLAWLLNHFVEDPARRLPVLTRARPRRTLAVVAAGTAAVAGLGVLALVVSSVVPLDGGRAVQATAPTDPPTTTSYVPRDIQPSLRAAVDDNAALYADGCQVGYTPSIPHPCTFGSGDPRVVLFGDSHAAAWFPAFRSLASTDGFQLVTQTKSACPSVDVALVHGGQPYVRCDRWRQAVIDQLRADPPDVVVLANYSSPDYADPTDRAAQWQSGLESTISELQAFTTVVVMADTPDLVHDPIACLSQHLTSTQACALPVSTALNASALAGETTAAETTGATLIDLSDYFCDDTCPAVIGDTLVYRDSHHMTATFAAEMAGPLGSRLTPVLTG